MSKIVFLSSEEGDWCVLYIDNNFVDGDHSIGEDVVAVAIADHINKGEITVPVTVHWLERPEEWWDEHESYPHPLPLDCQEEIEEELKNGSL
jgi:hypothetical protein